MRRLTFALLAGLLIGCTSTSTPDLALGPTDSNVAGTFNLTTANGVLLPILATVTQTEEWDLVADQLVLAADGSWTETTSYLITAIADGSTRNTSTSSSGNYAIANSQINFVRTVGGSATFSASVSGNVLSMLFNGGHFVYTR